MARLEIPESVTELSAEDLSAAIESALAEAGEFGPDEELSAEQVDRLEALAAFVSEANTETESRAAAEKEKADRLSAARATLTRPEEDDPEPEPEPEPEVTDTSETPAPEAEASPEPEAPETPAPEAEAEVAEPEKEPVVASGTSAADRAAGNTKDVSLPERPSVAMTAGAEVPGHALGQKFDGLTALGEAFIDRFRAMSPNSAANGTRYNVGKMTLPRTDGLVADGMDAQEVFTQASKESRLPGGSLTESRRKSGVTNALTAAGWCAPSETLFGLCGDVAVDGLINLPEVQINRGGIRYTQSPDVSTIDISAIGFRQTEAQADAGTTKPCEEIPCPDFIEKRLDATGICIKAGLLQRSAYPELVEQYMQTYMALYQHRYSMDVINELSTLIGNTGTFQGVWENAWSLLSAIELVAAGYRQEDLISLNQTLEVVLPHWVLPALRADLANRNGVDSRSVTDAELLNAFAVRGLAPQFVRHYQDLDTSGGFAETYPTDVEFMIFPAGSYVLGTTDVITLDAVYDSVGLSTNTYTALFAETGFLVAEMCDKGKRVTVPLQVTGRTAANDIAEHFTAVS